MSAPVLRTQFLAGAIMLIAPKSSGSIDGRLNQQRENRKAKKEIYNEGSKKITVFSFGRNQGVIIKC
jgi:hypothetical protein